MWQNFCWVGLGGAIGACLRYGVSEWSYRMLGKAHPHAPLYATLFVNLLGCVIIGALYSAIAKQLLPASPWRAFVGVGLLGALTTFSTFSFDTIALLQQGAMLKALLNIGANIILCILGAWIGMHLINLKG